MPDNPENLPQMLIRPHLGGGDFLICNAIFRHFAQSYNVSIPCKRHNCATANFMLRDVKNIELLPIEDDKEADEFCTIVAQKGFKVLKLGMFGQRFDIKEWDKSFYRQAGVPFEKRWSEFTCQRQPSRELKPPEGQFCFIHEDPSRGILIDRSRLPQDMPWVFAKPGLTQNLFDWWEHLEKATELHLMESCFAVLADSLPELQARRVVIHAYARNSIPPTYAQRLSSWEILRS